MRLLLDEQISGRIAEQLRAQGQLGGRLNVLSLAKIVFSQFCWSG